MLGISIAGRLARGKQTVTLSRPATHSGNPPRLPLLIPSMQLPMPTGWLEHSQSGLYLSCSQSLRIPAKKAVRFFSIFSIMAGDAWVSSWCELHKTNSIRTGPKSTPFLVSL